MTDQARIAKLKLATKHLKEAQRLVSEALGKTDSAQTVHDDIEYVIEDLDVDIVYFQNGEPT